ncbi:MAG TPA: DUF3422 domain-containing protein [Burkholderiaceae bacterium]
MIEHPDRISLHNELHARPRPALAGAHRVSHVAMLRARGERQVPDALARLCRDYHLAAPEAGQSHCFADFGAFQLKWERHGEFDDYTVYRPGADPARPFAEPAIAALPEGWLGGLPGELIASAHVAIVPDDPAMREPAALARVFESPEVLGAEIGDAAGAAFSDLRLGADGFARFLLLDRSFTQRQAGREVQRLIELEVYRMMAMLGFPGARAVAAELDAVEPALSSLVERLESASAADEPTLLREITHLAATVERLAATSGFRFSATRAYQSLVWQRGSELREQRLPGVQTLTGFLSRRFGPAMAYCDSVAARLQASADRIARASSLLRTRVELERERQNQEMLSAMSRRAQLQLRLQQTVEGLSVAAITYYAAGLVGYLAKGGKAMGAQVDVDLAVGLSVVPIALAAAFGVRHIRRSIVRRLAREAATPAD